MTSPLVSDPTLIPVGPTTGPLISGTGRGGGPVMLVNTDVTNTAYAGYSTSISPGGTNTVAIPPLGSVTMDGSRTLYGVAPVQLLLQVVPGGTTWSPSPAQIATQLVNSTLAAAIADAISAAGVPPIDDPAPLSIIFQQNIAAGATFTSPEISVGQYQSWVGTMFSAATSAGTGTNPYTKMHIAWSLTVDNFDPLHAEDWVVPNSPYSFTYVYRNDLQGPIFGNACQFTFTNYDTEPTLVTLGMFGSYRTRIRTAIRGRYAWNSDGTPDDAAGMGSDSIITSYNTGAIAAGNTSTPALMNLFSGPAVVSGSVTGAAPVWEVEIEPQPESVLGSAIDLVGSGEQLDPVLIMLPRRVCTIAVHNAGASNAITASQIVVIGQEQPE